MSASIQDLLKHPFRDPFRPAGAPEDHCNLCKRPVKDKLFHGELAHSGKEWDEILVDYFDGEQVELTRLTQIQQRGRRVSPESIRAQRHEFLWEAMLQKIFTDEERLRTETDIYRKTADGLQDAIVQIDAEDAAATRAQQVQVVERPSVILGPTGQPLRRL